MIYKSDYLSVCTTHSVEWCSITAVQTLEEDRPTSFTSKPETWSPRSPGPHCTRCPSSPTLSPISATSHFPLTSQLSLGSCCHHFEDRDKTILRQTSRNSTNPPLFSSYKPGHSLASVSWIVLFLGITELAEGGDASSSRTPWPADLLPRSSSHMGIVLHTLSEHWTHNCSLREAFFSLYGSSSPCQSPCTPTTAGLCFLK